MKESLQGLRRLTPREQPARDAFWPHAACGARADHPKRCVETKGFLNLLRSSVEFIKIPLPKVTLMPSWHHWIARFLTSLLAHLPLNSDPEWKRSHALLCGHRDCGAGPEGHTDCSGSGGGLHRATAAPGSALGVAGVTRNNPPPNPA